MVAFVGLEYVPLRVLVYLYPVLVYLYPSCGQQPSSRDHDNVIVIYH